MTFSYGDIFLSIDSSDPTDKARIYHLDPTGSLIESFLIQVHPTDDTSNVCNTSAQVTTFKDGVLYGTAQHLLEVSGVYGLPTFDELLWPGMPPPGWPDAVWPLPEGWIVPDTDDNFLFSVIDNYVWSLAADGTASFTLINSSTQNIVPATTAVVMANRLGGDTTGLEALESLTAAPDGSFILSIVPGTGSDTLFRLDASLSPTGDVWADPIPRTFHRFRDAPGCELWGVWVDSFTTGMLGDFNLCGGANRQITIPTPYTVARGLSVRGSCEFVAGFGAVSGDFSTEQVDVLRIDKDLGAVVQTIPFLTINRDTDQAEYGVSLSLDELYAWGASEDLGSPSNTYSLHRLTLADGTVTTPYTLNGASGAVRRGAVYIPRPFTTCPATLRGMIGGGIVA